METDAQQVPLEYEEILLYCEGKLLYCDLATKQTGQGGCGVSLTGHIPELSVPCALGWLYLSREVGQEDPR